MTPTVRRLQISGICIGEFYELCKDRHRVEVCTVLSKNESVSSKIKFGER